MSVSSPVQANDAMDYTPTALPRRTRRLPGGGRLCVSDSGDHVLLTEEEWRALVDRPQSLPLGLQARLKARYFLSSQSVGAGTARLLASRRAAKRETVRVGPSLHILVPTLQCAHSCQYCQVSRSLSESSHAMSPELIDRASDSVFESGAPTVTVEYQGGDPLIRFDLVQRSIERIAARNAIEQKTIRFVVASTLHQLTPEMCRFLRAHSVFLSTSIDGPASLHNRNRPTPTRDAFERTVAGIELARGELGPQAVSALMTVTRASLPHAEAIVDEYVRLGLRDLFLRPLSLYGFAKRNQPLLGYSVEQFKTFYEAALERVIHWNRQGYPLREAYTSIVLNKVLCTFDAGYVDLQSPTGSGTATVVYNYDGWIYPSDEARMLAEAGDASLRLGRIGTPLKDALASPVQMKLLAASQIDASRSCAECTYNLFCGPDPVAAQGAHGDIFAPVELTDHCRRHLWLFDNVFERVQRADDWLLDLYHDWALPAGVAR